MKIKEIRKSKHITQMELAEAIAVKQGTLSRYESGTIDIPLSIMLKIADYLNESLDYLCR